MSGELLDEFAADLHKWNQTEQLRDLVNENS